MAFGKAFAMMGSKGPGGKDLSVKGSAKPTPPGSVSGEPSHGEEADHLSQAVQSAHEADPSSKHMIVSHDGFGIKSHGIHEDGQHDGPHEHENIEALKQHMGKFFDEEEGEGADAHGDDEDGGEMSMGGFKG